MPSGWMPPSGWTPDPTWPKAPPLWAFSVDSGLRMRPIPLDEDINLGHPSSVTREQIASTAQGAADSIAWRIAGQAGETGQPAAVAHLQNSDLASKAIQAAKSRVFDRILAEARAWVHSLPLGSDEQLAAVRHSRMILDCRDSFASAASRRISDVLNAATQTENRPSPPRPSPTEAAPRQGDSNQSKPQPAAAASSAMLLDAIANYKRAVRKLAVWAWVHAAIFTVGLFITLAGYSSASKAGGSYIVFYGAIVWGAIGCFRNGYRYYKVKDVIVDLQQKLPRPQQRTMTSPYASPSGRSSNAAPQSRSETSPTILSAEQVKKGNAAVGIVLAVVLFAVVAIGSLVATHTAAPGGVDSQLANSLTSSGWNRDSSSGLYWKWIPSNAHCTTTSGPCSQVQVESAGPACPNGASVILNLLSTSGSVIGTAEGGDGRSLPAGLARTIEVAISQTGLDKVQINKLVCHN